MRGDDTWWDKWGSWGRFGCVDTKKRWRNAKFVCVYLKGSQIGTHHVSLRFRRHGRYGKLFALSQGFCPKTC